MKKIPVYFLVLLLLTIVVTAVKPVTTTSISQGVLSIETPLEDYRLKSTTFDLYAHVYNSTGHGLTNKTCNCLVHVYDSINGQHILKKNMSFTDEYDFEVEINASLIPKKGLYPFLIQCNTTTEGGFLSTQFEINDHSTELTNSDTTPGISLVIFILFSTALMFLLPTLLGIISKNPIVDILIKRCFYIIGFYLMVMNSAIIHSIATSAGYATAEITRYMFLFGWAGYLLIVATFIKTTFDLILTWNNIKRERRGL